MSLPAVAVILTVPALTAVTTPVLASTVAIVSSADLKDTVFFGVALAVIVVVSPTANSVAAALTVNVGFLTVIVAFNDLALPFLGVTLTVFYDKTFIYETTSEFLSGIIPISNIYSTNQEKEMYVLSVKQIKIK